MDKLEELLPGIDDFIISTLSKENLSSLAERKREYYVERLQFLHQPPSLPPRPAQPKVTDSPKLPPARRPSKEPVVRKPSKEENEDEPPPPPPPPLRQRKSLLPRAHTYTPPALETITTTAVIHNGEHEAEEETEGGDEDFAAKQRRIAREASSDKIVAPAVPLLPRAVPPPVPDPIEDSDHYSDIDRDDFESDGRSLDGDGEGEDMYEVPTNVSETPSGSINNLAERISQKTKDSDTESGTSYESYDDEHKESHKEKVSAANKKQEDGDVPTAEEPKSRDDIPLPSNEEPGFFVRIKSKRKKKKSHKEHKEDDDQPVVTAIKNITCRGDLYQKRKVMWARRYCILANKSLLIYNSEKDTKTLSSIPMHGSDVMFLEKEGRRYNVIRVAHSGVETNWFSAETKDETEIWLEHMMNASGLADDAGSETRSISSVDKVPASDQPSILLPTISKEGKDKGSTSTLSHGSEEGSTSTDHLPVSPIISQVGDTSPKNKKGISDKLSSFFSIGKKKGKKTASHIHSTDVETVEGSLYSPVSFEGAPPTISIAGRFKVMRDPEAQEWEEMYCQVKNGLFEVYEHHTDNKDILTFPLFGCEVKDAPEVRKDLAIKIAQGGNHKITFEPLDPLEQGNWLNVLIRATNQSKAPPEDSNHEDVPLPAIPDPPSVTTDEPVNTTEQSLPKYSRNEIFSTSADSLGYEHIYEESATLTESFLKALEEGGTFGTSTIAESAETETPETENVKEEVQKEPVEEVVVDGAAVVPHVRVSRVYDVPADESSDEEDDGKEHTDHVYDSVSMNSGSVAASDKDEKERKDFSSDEEVFGDRTKDTSHHSDSDDQHLWHDDHDIYESCFENQLESGTHPADKDKEPVPESVIQQDKEMLENTPNPVLAKIRKEKLQRRRLSATSVSSAESATSPTSPARSVAKQTDGKVADIKKKFMENEKRLGGSESKLNTKSSHFEKKSMSLPEDSKLNKSCSESQLSRLATARLSYQEKRGKEGKMNRRSFQKNSTDSVPSSSENKSLDRLSVHSKQTAETASVNDDDKSTARSSVISTASSAMSETTLSVKQDTKQEETKRSNVSLNSVEKANMYAMPDKLTKRHNKPSVIISKIDVNENGDVYEDTPMMPPKIGISGSIGDVRSKDKKKHKDSAKTTKNGKEKRISRFFKDSTKDKSHSKETESKEHDKSHSSKESLLDDVKLRKHSKTSIEDDDIDNDPELKKIKARIEELNASIAETKKQRSAIKEQKSISRQHSEKKALDEELRYHDNQLKNLEREIDEEEHELSCVIRLKHSSSNMNRSGIRRSMREVKSRVQERLKQFEDLSVPTDDAASVSSTTGSDCTSPE